MRNRQIKLYYDITQHQGGKKPDWKECKESHLMSFWVQSYTHTFRTKMSSLTVDSKKKGRKNGALKKQWN